MKRATQPSVVVLTYTAALISLPAQSAQTPLQVIAAAVQKEGSTTSKSVHLEFDRAGTKDVYTLEERLPDRLHLTRSNAGHTLEVIAVAPTTYTRWDGGAWSSAPMTKSPVDMSAVASVLLQGLTQIKETPAKGATGAKQREFTGLMSWTNRGTLHSGKLTVAISSASHLPLRMSFTGTCNGAPCSFLQTFSYSAAIRIEPPTP